MSTPAPGDIGFLAYALSLAINSLRLTLAPQLTIVHLLIARSQAWEESAALPFEGLLYDTVSAHFCDLLFPHLPELSSHDCKAPNILGAPLAIVSVDDVKASGGDDRPSSFVGFLMPYYFGKLPYYKYKPQDDALYKTDGDLKGRLRYAFELASAVQFLQQNGISTRDIKPANLVLTAPPPNNRPVLIDLEGSIVRAQQWRQSECSRSGRSLRSGDAGWKARLHDLQGVLDPQKILTIRQDWADMPEALERLEVFGV
ncbi:hypothetical protein OC844_004074 [Tilletia horrida]|nr:hypothetical protein OC844_004074 [Tilletia horrida]